MGFLLAVWIVCQKLLKFLERRLVLTRYVLGFTQPVLRIVREFARSV